MNEKSASQQIDDIISKNPGWKGDLLKELRAVITGADDSIVEEIKWRMKTRPEGLAVWSQNGIICFAEIWKDNIKLLFPKGDKLKDPAGLFNTRLQSKDVRGLEFKEGSAVDKAGLIGLVESATMLNRTT